MAYVPTYVHDVFLSYASVDNGAETGTPWVSRFRIELERELRSELAVWGDRRLVVWQDVNRLNPCYSLSQSIRDALTRAAVLVSLWSPGYLASDYCAEEREYFRTNVEGGLMLGRMSRLVNVVIRSNADVARLVPRDDLFSDFSSPGGPVRTDSTEFEHQLRKLVKSLVELLTNMRQRAPAVYVSLPRASDSTAIASKTLELLEDLSHAGYRRTSEIHPQVYQTDMQLEEEVASALFSVHLVHDPSDHLSRRQIEASQRTRSPMVVWLSDEARRSKDSQWIRETVPGPSREYSEEPFPEFRERVKRVLSRLAALTGQGAFQPGQQKLKRVFFLYHPQKDRDAAAAIRRRLESENFEVICPGRGADEALKNSDGVLVYHRTGQDDWFETKLRTVKDTRTVKAAWPVEPPDKTEARQRAMDFKFRPFQQLDAIDPRVLIDSDGLDSLTAFINLVHKR